MKKSVWIPLAGAAAALAVVGLSAMVLFSGRSQPPEGGFVPPAAKSTDPEQAAISLHESTAEPPALVTELKELSGEQLTTIATSETELRERRAVAVNLLWVEGKAAELEAAAESDRFLAAKLKALKEMQ